MTGRRVYYVPIIALACAPSLSAQERHPYGELSARPEAVEALARVAAGEVPRAARAPEPTPGDQADFQVFDFSAQERITVTATLVHVGLWSEVWTSEGQDAAALAPLIDALESATPADPSRGIVELEQDVFGPAPDVAGTGRLTVLVTDIQDGWSSGCGCSYVAGFFDPVDLDAAAEGSNGRDMIYVDSEPAMVSPAGALDPDRVLGTLAHEYQHLLHARGGGLSLFQNEGQSEWASRLTGHFARGISYLDLPGETSGNLYRWSSGDASLDYQRAALFHGYLADRVGADALGAISQSGLTGEAAYEAALAGSGITLEQLLLDFHVAAALGGANPAPDLRHSAPYTQVRLHTPSERFEGVEGGGTLRSVEFGGADFVEIVGAADLSLTLGGEGIAFAVITRDEAGARQVRAASPGAVDLAGEFTSVMVVATQVEPSGASGATSAPRLWSLDGSWTPLPMTSGSVGYADLSTLYWLTSLPFGAYDAFATRLTPPVTGAIDGVSLGLTTFFDGSPNPSGEGTLVLELTRPTAQEDGSTVPGEVLATAQVDLADLAASGGFVDVSGEGWSVSALDDVWLLLRVEGSGVVTLDLDDGSTDPNHPGYYPARSRRHSEGAGWNNTWLNNGNLRILFDYAGEVTHAPLGVALASPADGEEGLGPLVELGWHAAAAASGYQAELDALSTEGSPDWTWSGVATSATFDGLPLGERFAWRVRAVNAAGAGPWSPLRTFATQDPPSGEELLSYHDSENLLYYVTLPFGTETRWAMRYSPLLSGQLAEIGIRLTSSEVTGGSNPSGSGALKVELTGSTDVGGEGSDDVRVPGESRAALTLPLSELLDGDNTITLPGYGWDIVAGEEFHLVVSVLGEGSLSLDLDAGSLDTGDPDYYPARTRRYFSDSDAWSGTWLNNGNFAITARVVEQEATPTPPTPTDPDGTPLEPTEEPTAPVASGTPGTESPDTPQPETAAPTAADPTEAAPTEALTAAPTSAPTPLPTSAPTQAPTASPAPTSPGDDVGGCGCQSGQGSAGVAAWLLLLALPLRRRAQRP